MISVIIENENQIIGNSVIVKNKEDINHLKNSFRVKEGDLIRGTDGKFEYILKVTEVSKKELTAEIISKNIDTFTSDIEVTAAIGILKNDKMNLTIQKLTEIGINKIIPFFSKRCVVKLNEKKEKWDLISKEALKQCQGVKFVEISQPKTLKDLNLSDYDFVLVPYEATKDRSLRNVIDECKVKPKKILYIIGPEGGFAEEEIKELQDKEAKIVTLGPRILRAETAAIIVGGVLLNEF